MPTLFTRRAASLRLAACALAPAAAAAHAQTWPSKPVRFIVSTTPGGPSDTLARGLAQHLGERTGVATLVENRPGANSIIGTDAAAKAAPDGYTFLVTTGTAITINQHVFRKLPYDPEKDLVPVGKMGMSNFLLYGRNGLPLDNARDLIAYARANPERVSVGINGVATPPHFAIKQLEMAAGVRFNIAQYKGAAPALNDLVAGQVDLVMEAPLLGLAFVKSGRIKALAATGAKRFDALPQVGTLGELYPGFEAFSWFGAMAPTGTPRDIIQRLNQDIQDFLAAPAARERLLAMHLVLEGGSPGQMAEFIGKERAQWGDLIKRTGIKVET